MLRILTWNLYQRPRLIASFLDLPHLPERRERLRGILRLIDESDYHVLCLQEVFTGALRRALLRRFPHAYRELTRWSSLRLHGGLIILSRIPIRKREGWIFRGAMAGGRVADAWVDKGVMRATLDLPDGPLHLFNTHFQAEGRFAQIRAAQMEQLCDFLDRAPGRAVLAGDFNLEDSELARLDHLVSRGFVDAWRAVHPDDPGETRPESGRRYDYIFIRGVRLRGTALLSTRWSDHHGLSAAVEPV